MTGIILKFKAGTVSYQDYLTQEDTWIVSPLCKKAPDQHLLLLLYFTIQFGEYITHICLSNRRLEQITAFLCVSPGHCLCRARSKTSALLCREVRFFIAELCSEAVVYTRSSCVYTRACFKQVRTAEDGRTNRHRK